MITVVENSVIMGCSSANNILRIVPLNSITRCSKYWFNPICDAPALELLFL